MVYEKFVKDNSSDMKKKDDAKVDLMTCIIKTREDLITANNNFEFAD